jgi:type IX secretion system substrate protein
MRYLLLTLLTALPGIFANAQFYNAGTYYVSSGTTFTSTGDFTNTAGANYRNDGTAIISGNVNNDQASLPAGAGTTIFNGTSIQTIAGSQPFGGLNVTLNNASGLNLANRLFVGDGTSGTLTFTSGLITAGTSTRDVYFYPGSAYTGFDASHHIIGYTTKSGNTDFTFPIGDGTHTADLDLTGLSAAGDFQVVYNGTGYGTYNANAPITTNGVFNKEWWDIHQTAGAATAMVTLKWNDARNTLNHSDPGNLLVAHFTGGAWQSEGGSSSNSAGSSTGSVGPSNPVSTFSPFTFGSSTVALPIVLASFTVINKDCQASLSWSTGEEENASGFEIQQSTDGTSFTNVVFVKANGFPSTYNDLITQTAPNTFYRIRLVDLDGSFVYSPVASLQLTCLTGAENLSVYPNPVVSGIDMTVKYTVPSAKGEAQVQIFDMTGKRVYSEAVQVNAGTNTYSISGNTLAQGAYTIFIIGDGWKSNGVKVVRNNN